jgi:hypothetical protein
MAGPLLVGAVVLLIAVAVFPRLYGALRIIARTPARPVPSAPSGPPPGASLPRGSHLGILVGI